MAAGVTAEVVAEAVSRLRAAGCVFAEDEAQVLRQAAADDAALDLLVARRVLGEPLEQVVGWADFAGVRVGLLPGVFVPRVRSELLVTAAARVARSGDIVVDLCCGSGALGLATRHQVPGIELYAADLDPVAVECAHLNLGGNVFEGSLFAALPEELRGRVTVLLANVPYVATRHIPLLPAEARDHEPRMALDGGPDGLDLFRAVVSGAGAWLADGGVVLSEVTRAQLEAATEAVHLAGLDSTVVEDDDLDARVICGQNLVGRLR